MKENKTLEELYKASSRHHFGDITLLIENQGGKLRGKFLFHPVEADNTALEKSLVEKNLPACFGRPPVLLEAENMASIVWDERYRTLGDIIPLIEKEVVTFGQMWEKLGNRLALCAACPVFDRCYRIAEWNLQRKQAASKI